MERFKDRHTPIGVVSPSHELLQRTTTKEDAKKKELIAEVKGKYNVKDQYRMKPKLTFVHTG